MIRYPVLKVYNRKEDRGIDLKRRLTTEEKKPNTLVNYNFQNLILIQKNHSNLLSMLFVY